MEAENDRRPKKAGRNDQKAPTEKPLENVQAQPVDQPVILNELADQRKETQCQPYDRTYLTAYRLFGSGFGWRILFCSGRGVGLRHNTLRRKARRLA